MIGPAVRWRSFCVEARPRFVFLRALAWARWAAEGTLRFSEQLCSIALLAMVERSSVMKNYPMQYADREISVEDALEVLDEGEFITVATVDDDGMPYCVPLSYVVERGWGSVEGAGEGEEPVCRIYIHTTKNDGHKMADWRRDARGRVLSTSRRRSCARASRRGRRMGFWPPRCWDIFTASIFMEQISI